MIATTTARLMLITPTSAPSGMSICRARDGAAAGDGVDAGASAAVDVGATGYATSITQSVRGAATQART